MLNKKNGQLLLLAASSCVAWISVGGFAVEAAANQALPGFEIEQKSLIIGKVTVRANPKAVQIIEHGKGLIFVSRAPSWNLQILNPNTKTYFEGKIQDFSGAMTRGVTLFTGRTLTDATYEAKPVKEADGTLHYTTTAEYTKRESELKKNLSNGSGQPKTVELFVNPEIVVPPQAVSLLSRLYGFAEAKGMAVTVWYFDFDHTKKVFLTTQKWTKKEFSDADFAKRTAEYKRVATIPEVYRTPAQDAAVGELLEGLGKMPKP